MCGITGFFNPDGSYPVDNKTLEKMTSMLTHRGPDDDGYYIGEGIGLGQRRLSIIDIQGGKQPITNETKDIIVVYNGEIFNYIELMDVLKKKGHTFQTRCDTEVIAHAYEEYGDDFISLCNGQFAIALWDKRKQILKLFRDRVGIRPLFYTQNADQTLVFGSEIKSLFAHPMITPELDSIGLEQILSLWVPIPPRTPFKNIKELPPGCILTAQNGSIAIRRYWRVQFPDANGYSDKPLKKYMDECRELLHDAVSLRLRADVPVAAYLSGGLDSSIITALVKKYHNNNLITFSVTFDDTHYDESGFQNEMVKFLKTDHRSIGVNYSQIGKLFQDSIWYSEYPIIRTAPAPLFALSSLVRQNGIKVVLTGEGADEIFGGYNIFKEAMIRRFWSRKPDSKLRPQLLKKIYPYIQSNGTSDAFWQLFFRKNLTDVHNPYYSHLIRWTNTNRIQRLLHEKYRASINFETNVLAELDNYIDPDIKRWHPFCQAQYLEIVLFMSGYLLSSQGDRMMMGNSVEGRFPFLDYRVIEFASTVPPRYKMNGLTEKYLLKKTFQDIVPLAIIERPKQPYRAPIGQCFLDETGKNSWMLSDEALGVAGLFSPSAVSLLVDKLRSQSSMSIGAVDDMSMAIIISCQLLYHYFIHELPQNQVIHSPHNQTLYGGMYANNPQF